MFGTTCTLAQRIGLVTILGTASLAAQDLTVDVQRDPQNNVATYTATVTAPPGSSYWLFASPFTLPAPLPIPGILGTLDIDPGFMLSAGGPVLVDPAGTGTHSFSVSLGLLENLEIPFQALVLDPALTPAFSNLATATHGTEDDDFGLQWVGGYSRRTQIYRMNFFGGARGDRIEIKVNGVTRVQGTAGPTGAVNVRFTHDLQRGDRITICRNGGVIRTWLFC